MIKKILSPLIYGLFMIMSTAVSIRTMIMVGSFLTVDQINLQRFLIVIFILIISIPFYYFGNRLLNTFEESKKVSLSDHFRQCSLLYFVVLFSGLSALLRLVARNLTYSDNPLFFGVALAGLMVLLFTSSIVGIIMNGIFLYKRKRQS